MKKLLLALALAFGLGTPAFATTTANSIITGQTPNRGYQNFVQGTDTAGTYKAVYTAGANGSKCFGLWMTNNDASATHLVTVQVYNGTTYYGGTAVTTVVSAGFVNGTPAQNLLSGAIWAGLPIDGNGNPFLYLASGDTLRATYATSLTSTDLINIVAYCQDF